MSRDDEFAGLVGRLYEAATDPDSLSKICDVMAPHFGASSSIIHTCTQRSLTMRNVLSATADLDAWAGNAYAEHYHDRNVWFQRGIRKGPSVVVICEELVPESELLHSEWYDYCKRVGWFHCLGIGVSIADDLVGGIGFHRPRPSERYDEEDRRKAYLLLPHIERTLQIQHRLASVARDKMLFQNVIDGLAIGVVLVNGESRLLYANSVAERILQSGRWLSVSAGALMPSDSRQASVLARLVGEASRTSGGAGFASSGGTLLVHAAEGPPMPLLVSPFRAERMDYGPMNPAAILLFSDPRAKRAVSEARLQSLFGLTSAEARLAAALVGGKGLAAYASTTGISINTAKTQMRQVFEKAGVNRQTDLVRTVAANPALTYDPNRFD